MKEVGNTLIFSSSLCVEEGKRKELEKEISEKTGKEVIILPPTIQFVESV